MRTQQLQCCASWGAIDRGVPREVGRAPSEAQMTVQSTVGRQRGGVDEGAGGDRSAHLLDLEASLKEGRTRC